MKTVRVNCYNCHSKNSEFYAYENGFKYVKCKKCGLIYLNPRPLTRDLLLSHSEGIHHGERTIHVTGRYKPKKIKRYLKILKDFFKKEELEENDTWLDIGCGFGEFMESLIIFSDGKIRIRGHELNKRKIDYCKNKGLNVSKIDIENHNKKYNYISLLNVFSHLPDPVDYLNGIKKNLYSGGELFIETGHVSHIPAKHFPQPFYAPDHLSFANKEIIENILERLGFKIIKTKIYRGEIYPEFTDIIGVITLLAKIILRYKDGRIRNFFPKYPDIAMFIRARLK